MKMAVIIKFLFTKNLNISNIFCSKILPKNQINITQFILSPFSMSFQTLNFKVISDLTSLIDFIVIDIHHKSGELTSPENDSKL